MDTFSSRIRSYRSDMGLTQAQISELLGVERSTYTHYEGGGEPPLARCKQFCLTLGVTMDWLTGLAAAPKWGAAILQFRHKVAQNRPQLEALADVVGRVRRMLALMDECPTPLPSEWFQAGILGVSQEGFREFKSNSALMVGPQSTSRLAELASIPEMWLLLGNMYDGPLTVGYDQPEYQAALVDLAAEGISPVELLDAKEHLKRYVQALRTAKAPGR